MLHKRAFSSRRANRQRRCCHIYAHCKAMISMIVLLGFIMSIVFYVDAEGGKLLSSKVVSLVQLNSNHTEATRETEVVPYGCHTQIYHIALPNFVDVSLVKVLNSWSWEGVPFQLIEQNSTSTERDTLLRVPFRCACLRFHDDPQIYHEREQRCPASLLIKIVTDDVSLSPIAYNLRLLPTTDGAGYDMHVSSHVNVTQRSGENWDDISLCVLQQQALSDVGSCDTKSERAVELPVASTNISTTITTITSTTATNPLTNTTTTTVTTTSHTVPSTPAVEPYPNLAEQCIPETKPVKHLEVTVSVPTNATTNLVVQNVTLTPQLYSYVPLGSRVAFLKAQLSLDDDAALASILPAAVSAHVRINDVRSGRALLHTVQNNTPLPTSSPGKVQVELGPDPSVRIQIEHHGDYGGGLCTVSECGRRCSHRRVLRYKVHNQHSVPHIVLLSTYHVNGIVELTNHDTHLVDGGTSEQDFVSAVAAHVSQLRLPKLTQYVNIHSNKLMYALALQPGEVFEVKVLYNHAEYLDPIIQIPTPMWEGSDDEQKNIYPEDCCCKFCKGL